MKTNKIKLTNIILGIIFLSQSIDAQNASYQNEDTTILLNEVIVTAFQIETPLRRLPGSISLLSGQEIQVADGNNFAAVLNSVPGVYMHSGTYATSRIVIRGMGSRTPYNTNRIKAYLNDIPITSSDGISTPEDIDLTGLDKMEIVKGPSSALYGSGLGGSINLFTPSALVKSAGALLQYGSYNTLKASVKGTYTIKDFSFFGNLNRTSSDGYRENNRYERTSLISSGGLHKETYSVDYLLLLTDVYAGIPSSVGKTLYETDPRAAAANWKAIGGYKKYKRGIGGISLTNRLSEKWDNKLTVFTRLTDSYEKRPFNNLTDGTSGGGIRNKTDFRSEKFDAVLGIEWISDTYNWQLDLDGSRINDNSERRNLLNVFGLTNFRPSAEWNISVGGAMNSINYTLTDKFPENGDQSGKRSFPAIFSPRVGVNYAPTNRVALFASAGHGFSMPSPEETLLPEGDINKDIQPEKGWQFETGLRLNLFRNATQFEAAFYRINLNNLLVTKRLTEDIFTGINAGKTRHQGIELMLKQRIFNFGAFPGRLNMNASYTFSDNTFVDFTDDGNTYNGNTLPGIPSHLWQSAFRWDPLRGLSFDFRFQYTGSQFINDANTVKNDAYFLSDVKTTYGFSTSKAGRFDIFAGINNVTNTHYSPMLTVNAVAFGKAEPRYYYPGLPRHFYGGISWSF
ncbi:MAG: TonB-dependent receptor [Petrimonas sp.]|nr:TonB-dependent receptor [Petrimonas sp.]